MNHSHQLQFAKNILQRALSHHFAGFDDSDLRTQLTQFMQDVTADQNCLAHFFQSDQQFAHLNPSARIQTARRFIQQQEFGIVQQHAGQCQPLLHPPG